MKHPDLNFRIMFTKYGYDIQVDRASCFATWVKLESCFQSINDTIMTGNCYRAHDGFFMFPRDTCPECTMCVIRIAEAFYNESRGSVRV
jgi:hypothetical protein